MESIATVAVLHGGMPWRQRRASIHEFLTGKARVLVATDAAGEGLNLQERCRLVINLELPWNPLRLEQRIGRVDRIGQSRRVHGVHLYLAGSFEEHVLAQLEQRRRRAAIDLQQPIDEETLGRAVFEGESIGQPLRPSITRPQRVVSDLTRHAEISRRASMLARIDRSSPQPLCGVIANRPVSGSTLVFEWDITDGHGRLVARHVAALSIVFRRAHSLDPTASLRLIDSLAISPRVRGVLLGEMERAIVETRRRAAATADRIARRLNCLAARLHAAPRPLVQASLFDRRAERSAQAAEAAIASWKNHLGRRIEAAAALEALSISKPRLIAAWPF